jgi:MFS family permease
VRSIWCFAVLLSGVAPKFGLLVVARVLSGVGEASFQTVVPPYIDDIAPKVRPLLNSRCMVT